MTRTLASTSRRGFFTASLATSSFAASIIGTRTSADAFEESSTVKLDAMSPTAAQWREFRNLEHNGPIVMVNLLKYKTNGVTEYAKYREQVRRILKKIGARVIFSGETSVCLIGTAEWDSVSLVEYPNKTALVNMVESREYQGIAHHREAGIEGQVNYAVIQSHP